MGKEMIIKSICVVTDRYPTEQYPVNTFLDQLVCQFSEQGVRCTVIAPYSPVRDIVKRKNYHPGRHWVKKTKNGFEVDVYCPHIPMLTGRKIAGVNFSDMYVKLSCRAIETVIKKENIQFDVLYAHFICPAGLVAAKLSEKYEKPFFVAYGESSIDLIKRNYSLDIIAKRLSNISGIISVSAKNKMELLNNHVANEEKIGVFPNSIDTFSFHCMDKIKLRKQYGIDLQFFIVAFVGDFIERKGSRRVSEAIEKLDGVYSFFIGAGDQKPECKGILHMGRVPHNKIVHYLNMADAFVLPTQSEGCCNAIIEAMACGLPVISSNGEFNDDILNDACSIRIDPNNVEEIAYAIEKLKADVELRKSMSAAALRQAAGLTLDKRASAILQFMNEKVEKEGRA